MSPDAAARILVVEDEEGLGRLLVAILEEQGYQVELARDGEEGLRRALAEPAPDLAVLDVMLPRRSGFSIIEAIRADPARKGLRVLVVSGKGDDQYRDYGTTLGADAYLAKPFDMPDLVREVRRLLGR